MNRKSIIQEYFVLAVNENGTMPAMRRDESNAGMTAAGIMDLFLNDVITVEKKRITVIKDLPEELAHLASLYTYLKEKPRSTDKVMSDYVYTGSRLRRLMADTGESLCADHAAVKGEGGFFGNKTIYIPEKSYKEKVIGFLKSALLKDDELTSHDMSLLCILKETGNLNQYVSEYERDTLKSRLKEMKKNPQSKQMAGMIHYIDDMTAVIAAFIVTNVCI